MKINACCYRPWYWRWFVRQHYCSNCWLIFITAVSWGGRAYERIWEGRARQVRENSGERSVTVAKKRVFQLGESSDGCQMLQRSQISRTKFCSLDLTTKIDEIHVLFLMWCRRFNLLKVRGKTRHLVESDKSLKIHWEMVKKETVWFFSAMTADLI